MDVTLILNAIVAGKDYAILAIAIISMLSGSARGAIATVSEVASAGVALTDEQALQKASDMMGKYTPFIPDFVRKWMLQKCFDNMKNVANKELKK
jgi:hypothetical protein